MDDLEKYIEKRKKIDSEFAFEFDSGYENFKIGSILKELRETAGLTKEEIAQKLNTKNQQFLESKIMPKILSFQHC